MAETFKALVVDRDAEKKQFVEVRDLTLDDLMEGDVVVRVRHSTVNYKDGLAITGKLPVVRRWPMIPGIDFCGEVVSSENPDFKPGDEVILNGWGVGETHYGAYAKFARVKGDWLIKKPRELSLRRRDGDRHRRLYGDALRAWRSSATASLPARGPVVVTGAAGGVGSVAVALLKKLGYHVIASTGRAEEHGYLKDLGAAEIIGRDELVRPAKASRQGALGGRRRHRRLDYPRERHRHDQGGRRGRRLRQCRRHGSSDLGRALHPARRVAARHQLRDAAEIAPRGSLGAARRATSTATS